ncbi:unnamed protein product [Rangifer tarandus platyrhynchus]|uniref:Uncharacterized protein n=1 Tax=Rangifer tarandus platyrhynchus TaxID=3082113 RepID=A0AC59Z122_RANTA
MPRGFREVTAGPEGAGRCQQAEPETLPPLPLTPAPLLTFIPTKPVIRMLNRRGPHGNGSDARTQDYGTGNSCGRGAREGEQPRGPWRWPERASALSRPCCSALGGRKPGDLRVEPTGAGSTSPRLPRGLLDQFAEPRASRRPHSLPPRTAPPAGLPHRPAGKLQPGVPLGISLPSLCRLLPSAPRTPPCPARDGKQPVCSAQLPAAAGQLSRRILGGSPCSRFPS